jgi:hypothetical protein
VPTHGQRLDPQRNWKSPSPGLGVELDHEFAVLGHEGRHPVRGGCPKTICASPKITIAPPA